MRSKGAEVAAGGDGPRPDRSAAGEAGERQLTAGLGGSVWALAVAPLADGRLLVAAGDTAGGIHRWDALTGESFGEPISTGRGVVRAMVPVPLPGGPTLLATAGQDGAVCVWDGATGAPTGVTIPPQAGPVWSMAAVPAAGGALLLTGGDDGRIHRWDIRTGEAVGEPFGDHLGAVRAMLAARLAGGRPMVVTGGDDGSLRRWDALTGHPLAAAGAAPGAAAAGHTGAIWGMALARLPSGAVLASSGNDSRLCRWDAATAAPLGGPISVGDGALPAVVAVTAPGGRVLLVAGSTSGWLYCWDAATGEPVGRPLSVPGRGVLSLAPATGADGRVRLVVGGSDGSVTVRPVAWAEATERRTATAAQVDAVPGPDALGRRILAAHLGGLLTELAASTASTSAVVHVDGHWGAGKSSLVELLLGDPRVPGAGWVPPLVVRYEAWRESATAPAWWSLSASIARAVRRSRCRWTRAFMLGWSLVVRTARSSASLTAVALLGAALLAWLAAPSPDWRAVGAVVTAVVGFAALAQAAGRALFWHSPPFGTVHLRTEDNPLGQVADLVGWLRCWAPRDPAGQRRRDGAVGTAVAAAAVVAATAVPVAATGRGLGGAVGPGGRVLLGAVGAAALVAAAAVAGWHLRWCRRLPGSRQPILLVIDDLDRCAAGRVVTLLETVHTLLRQPVPAAAGWREPARLYVLVLADGRWIRQAFAATFADFAELGSATRDLGADFGQKVFDHTVLVPDLSAAQVSGYLAGLVGPSTGDTAGPADAGPASPAAAAARVAVDSVDLTRLRSPEVNRLIADPELSAADREAVEVARVRREATAAATAARSEHLLQAYTSLLPANPRLIKRIANAFGMLLAIQSHTRHPEDEDAMARTAILLVRFPLLADRLRTGDFPAAGPEAADADPVWRRPEVREVLGGRSLAALARCLGHEAASGVSIAAAGWGAAERRGEGRRASPVTTPSAPTASR